MHHDSREPTTAAVADVSDRRLKLQRILTSWRPDDSRVIFLSQTVGKAERGQQQQPPGRSDGQSGKYHLVFTDTNGGSTLPNQMNDNVSDE